MIELKNLQASISEPPRFCKLYESRQLAAVAAALAQHPAAQQSEAAAAHTAAPAAPLLQQRLEQRRHQAGDCKAYCQQEAMQAEATVCGASSVEDAQAASGTGTHLLQQSTLTSAPLLPQQQRQRQQKQDNLFSQHQRHQQDSHSSILAALHGLQLPDLQHGAALAQLHRQLLSSPTASAGTCRGTDQAPPRTLPLSGSAGPSATGVQLQGILQAFGSQLGALPAGAQQSTASTQQHSAAATAAGGGPSDLLMFCMEAAADVMARQQGSQYG
jgi:hypothetical protein